MSKLRKVCVEQIEEMVEWLETHPLLLKSTMCKSSQLLWEELAGRLNELDGVERSTNYWRAYWSTFKFRARKRLLAAKKDETSIEETNLNRLRKRVLTLVDNLNLTKNTDSSVKLEIDWNESMQPESHDHQSSPDDSCSRDSNQEEYLDETMPEEDHMSPSQDTDPLSSPQNGPSSPTQEGPTDVGPPQWITDLEKQRLKETIRWRKLEEKLLQEDRIFHRDLLAELNRIADYLTASRQ